MKQLIILCTTVLFVTTVSFGQKLKDTVVDYDGNVYHTVKIGTQTWMVENLKVTHYCNGDIIPNVKDPIKWGEQTKGAYCNYRNDSIKVKTYGRLYNWYAAKDSRNIAPIGWHMPTDKDWQKLVDYLGGEAQAHDKMKEIDSTHWVITNKHVTNSSGFTGLPGGWRDGHGHYDMIGCMGGFWLDKKKFKKTGAWYRYLTIGYNITDGKASKYITVCGRTYGLSIRCVKD